MPLLEAMPIVWCAVLAFNLVYLLCCEKFSSAILISSAIGLMTAIAGVSPWLQGILWCGSVLLVCIVRKLARCRKQDENRRGLIIYRNHNGTSADILSHGLHCTGVLECPFAVMPPCGTVVQIFIYDGGTGIVCPR